MIGIILVSHGNLAKSFIETAELLFGDQKNIASLAVDREDDFQMMFDKLTLWVDKADEGQGVIILTDMFGGSASNIALSFMDGRNVEVIAGMNLPMLVRIIERREKDDLQTLALSAYDAGRKYIQRAADLLQVKIAS